jgi:hypothetical protein
MTADASHEYVMNLMGVYYVADIDPIHEPPKFFLLRTTTGTYNRDCSITDSLINLPAYWVCTGLARRSQSWACILAGAFENHLKLVLDSSSVSINFAHSEHKPFRVSSSINHFKLPALSERTSWCCQRRLSVDQILRLYLVFNLNISR